MQTEMLKKMFSCVKRARLAAARAWSGRLFLFALQSSQTIYLASIKTKYTNQLSYLFSLFTSSRANNDLQRLLFLLRLQPLTIFSSACAFATENS